tara:strand:+ start:714 stop:1979 length:1266 start_codon:yes stop_codon:yes gene_type:complete
MLQKNVFGFDFGTSNSAIASIKDSTISPILLENNNPIIPTALFYKATINEYTVDYGKKALENLEDGEIGRCFRSIKSSLGNDTFNDQFRIGYFVKSFEDVIYDFVKYSLEKAQQQTNGEIDGLIIGRPVQFVDDNPAQDKIAQNQLATVIKNLGVKNFDFQYEPIAAAISYEQSIEKPALALVIDLGGGTSDFTVIKVCKEYSKKADRKEDILATKGIHIGGNDVDSRLSMEHIMPYLGSESIYKQTNSPINKTLFHNMTLWHRIHLLNEVKHFNFLKNIPSALKDPANFRKFLKVIKSREGYQLANLIEKSKIKLTKDQQVNLDLDEIIEDLEINIKQDEFSNYIAGLINSLTKTIDDTLLEANVKNDEIEYLFFTGGTSLIPAIYNTIRSKFKNAKAINNNTFLSVTNGLAIDAHNKFY